MNFQTLLEKVKNPLRKQALRDTGQNVDNRTLVSLNAAQWKEYILYGKDLDREEQQIRDHYLQLKHTFPEKAEKWLNMLTVKYANMNLRTKLGASDKKIYQKQGVQVFVDDLATVHFGKDSYGYRIMKFAIDAFLWEIHDILPNRRPKIIITNKNTNGLFKNGVVKDPAAVYRDRLIYIDQHDIENPKLLVHEYAHFIADLIPKQTEPLLDEAYKKMLDFYWKKAKVKKQELRPSANTKEEMARAKMWRERISKYLGFPQYGLMDRDEFFAVIIENWKDLPNNTATYRYKQLVKSVLQRL